MWFCFERFDFEIFTKIIWKFWVLNLKVNYFMILLRSACGHSCSKIPYLLGKTLLYKLYSYYSDATKV